MVLTRPALLELLMSTSREVPFLGKSRKISEMHGAEAAGGADGTSATGIEVRGTMFECDGACGFSGHYSEVDASCSDLFKALLSRLRTLMHR